MSEMETKEQGKEPMLDIKHFRDDQRRIIEIIERIRGRGGEAYDEEGGHRNPVKPDTAPLLTAFAGIYRPKHIFEMGTAYGFSTLHFALGHSTGELTTVEFDEDVAEEAQRNLEAAGLNNWAVVAGTVSDVVKYLPNEAQFDMVFIDHRKDLYLPDFRAIEPFLESGAVILGDNVNDRRDENGEFVDYVLAKYGGQILPTQAGLLVATT